MAPFSLSTFSPVHPPAVLFNPPRRGLQARRNFLKIGCFASVSASLPSALNLDVVVTRGRGKNGKLVTALALHLTGLSLLHLKLLADMINELEILICKASGAQKVRIGVVGAGTTNVFEEIPPSLKLSLTMDFAPSKATGKDLAAELPDSGYSRCTVLYPASAKAGNEVEEGLAKRAFEVTRLNTYSTEPVSHVDQMVLEQALFAPVIAVASPSAVRAWVSLIPEPQQWDNAVACIGETTALAARKLGLRNVYFSANPGLEGWVNSILEALQAQNLLQKV